MRTSVVTATLVLLAATASPTHVEGQGMIVEDIVYAHVDGMATVYDVRTPASPNGAGVIFVISGGFLSTRGQQSFIAPVAEPLLSAGFTVFYLRHPSTPRYLAPEIYDTIRAGVAHILENATDFGVDASRIGIMGMSTGGILALLLAMDVRPEASSEQGERPAAVVAYMPVVDMRTEVGNVRATPSLGFAPELAPSLSPVDFVSSDDPPVLSIHGQRDEVVPIAENSVRLQALLTEAGVPNDLVVVDAGHELFAGEAKSTADQAAVGWLRRHLLD
ncbi:MAG TPA: alpha/beta hydrolase [Longimicrobiales bacterium]|nr:alpha/beta hydrolase [Longimicrobiales bacterium]